MMGTEKSDIKVSLPWSYEKRLREFLKDNTRVLDIDTGNGDFLLSLGHRYDLTSLTVTKEEELNECLKRLSPLGITVKFSQSGELPFEPESFDLVLSRHGRYSVSEINGVLKKGGHFITEQIGGNGTVLGKTLSVGSSDYNLENQAELLKQAGFKIVYADQFYPELVFSDVSSLMDHIISYPDDFPGSDLDGLDALNAKDTANKEICLTAHRFIIVAKKLR